MQRGFFTILSGAGAAMLLTVLALPVLGRLYDATAFGQLGAVMAVVSLAAVAVHGRYQLAIATVESDTDAVNILALTVLSAVLLSVPVAALVIAALGRAPEGLTATSFVALTAALTAMVALLDCATYWRNRHDRFQRSAAVLTIRTVVVVALQITLFGWAGFGLIAGAIGGALTALMLSVADIIQRDRTLLAGIRLSAMLRRAREHRHHPLYGMPQGWLAALSWNGLPLLLIAFGETALAGQFWVAYRLLIAPVTVFGGVYRQTILPRLRKLDGEAGRALCLRHTLWLAGPVAICAALTFTFGEAGMVLLMGEGWGVAGRIAGWLALGVAADVLKVPAICFMQSTDRQRTVLGWELTVIVPRYAIVFVALWTGEPMHAFVAFALTGLGLWVPLALAGLRPRAATAVPA